MARLAREKSESGFYHVIIRGIGRQILFEDDEDRIRFLKTIQRYKSELSISLYTYCLMENHVHLLLHDKDQQLDMFMKRLEGSYAFYFNSKYERIGTLFQDRFKSEPVEDDAYYLTVLRYIIRNPEKAGICRHCDYPWNNYREFFEGKDWTDTAFTLGLFDSTDDLKAFLEADTNEKCLEVSAGVLRDSEAKEIIRRTLNADSGTVLQSYGQKERNAALRQLRSAGLSIRQIERLTGLSRGVIQKA